MKLSAKAQHLLFITFMVTIMSCVISLTLTIIKVGFEHGLMSLLHQWLRNWATAWIVAWPTAYLAVPAARAAGGWWLNVPSRMMPPNIPTDPQSRVPANPLMTGKVIIGAFMTGLVTFGLVAVFMGPSVRKNQPAPDPQLSLILGALMGGLFVLACIFGLGVMSAVLRSQAKRVWETRANTEDGAMGVAKIFLNRTILRGAMFEGPGLLGGVITLLTGSWIGIAGLAASLLLLIGVFPTRAGMQSFFESVMSHEHIAK